MQNKSTHFLQAKIIFTHVLSDISLSKGGYLVKVAITFLWQLRHSDRKIARAVGQSVRAKLRSCYFVKSTVIDYHMLLSVSKLQQFTSLFEVIKRKFTVVKFIRK